MALWSLVAALIFSGAALTWLVFADAIALGVAAMSLWVRVSVLWPGRGRRRRR